MTDGPPRQFLIHYIIPISRTSATDRSLPRGMYHRCHDPSGIERVYGTGRTVRPVTDCRPPVVPDPDPHHHSSQSVGTRGVTTGVVSRPLLWFTLERRDQGARHEGVSTQGPWVLGGRDRCAVGKEYVRRQKYRRTTE